MKTVGIEIQRRQIAVAWISVPDHWDHDRVTCEATTHIEAIREAADRHEYPLQWDEVYGPQYFLSAVIGLDTPLEHEPDYCFPDEAPPPPPSNPNQITLEL